MSNEITKTGYLRQEDISSKKVRLQTKLRGFELVLPKYRTSKQPLLPIQGSKYSAGYDFRIPENLTIIIEPKQTVIIPTDVRAYMQIGEQLKLYNRSSIALKMGLKLGLAVAIIDMDYYNNIESGGNIHLPMENTTDKQITLTGGERLAQGVFEYCLKSDNCNSDEERVGGIGSSGVY